MSDGYDAYGHEVKGYTQGIADAIREVLSERQRSENGFPIDGCDRVIQRLVQLQFEVEVRDRRRGAHQPSPGWTADDFEVKSLEFLAPAYDRDEEDDDAR